MGGQASSRSTGHRMPGVGTAFWPGPGNSVNFLYHSFQSVGSLSPELIAPLPLGITRISLFQKVLDILEHQATVPMDHKL